MATDNDNAVRFEADWLAARQLAAALEQMTEDQLVGFIPAEGVAPEVAAIMVSRLASARDKAVEFLRNLSVQALEAKEAAVDAADDAERRAFKKKGKK